MLTNSQYFNKIEKEEAIAERVNDIYEASIESTIESLEDILKDLKSIQGIADVDEKQLTLKSIEMDLTCLSDSIGDFLAEAKNVEGGF